jgi:hypothetical protein
MALFRAISALYSTSSSASQCPCCREFIMSKLALTLKFKCTKCAKPVTLYLQKTSACSHITPYQGWCKCGQLMRHATGDKEAVASFVDSMDPLWSHRHHHHH